MLNNLERIFEIFDLNDFFMCRIEILEVNGFINVRVGIFKEVLFHVDLIDFKFDLFDVFSSHGENDFILRFKEFLCFFSNNGDLFGFFEFFNLEFRKDFVKIGNLFTFLKFNFCIEIVNNTKFKISVQLRLQLF